MPADTYLVPAPPRRPGAPSKKRSSTLRAPTPASAPAHEDTAPTVPSVEIAAEPIEPAKAHRGAPLGNTNALKHGFYARAFRPAEQSELASIDPASLENEIELLRVFILRVAVQADKVTDLTESLTLLNVMSRASLSLAALMRTQRAAVAAHDHEQFQQLLAGAKAQFAKANALTSRLNQELADLEEAWDAASQDLSEPAAEEPEDSLDADESAPLAQTLESAGPIEADDDSEDDDEDLDPTEDDDELEECTPPGDCYTCDDTARASCDACPDYLRPKHSNSHAALRRALALRTPLGGAEPRPPEGEAPRTPGSLPSPFQGEGPGDEGKCPSTAT